MFFWNRQEDMRKSNYAKGNCMTFPLELTEVNQENYVIRNDYLYPMQVRNMQMAIQEMCDKMEYDGSLMYDEYPDKVCVERLARKACENAKNCRHSDEISIRWMQALAQVMLCNEMAYRRERRRCHKRNMGINY